MKTEKWEWQKSEEKTWHQTISSVQFGYWLLTGIALSNHGWKNLVSVSKHEHPPNSWMCNYQLRKVSKHWFFILTRVGLFLLSHLYYNSVSTEKYGNPHKENHFHAQAALILGGHNVSATGTGSYDEMTKFTKVQMRGTIMVDLGTTIAMALLHWCLLQKHKNPLRLLSENWTKKPRYDFWDVSQQLLKVPDMQTWSTIK